MLKFWTSHLATGQVQFSYICLPLYIDEKVFIFFVLEKKHHLKLFTC